MRQLLFFALCAVPLFCSAEGGAGGSDVFGSKATTILAGKDRQTVAQGWHHYGHRGPRGHRGKRGHRGDQGRRGRPSPSFSKAVYILNEGAGPFPIPTTTSPAYPYVVPLSPNVLDTRIGFNGITNSFVIKVSGTYLAEFYMKVFGALEPYGGRYAQGYVVMALRNLTTNTLLAQTKLVPTNMWAIYEPKTLTLDYTDVAFGTQQKLLHLNQGDQLQLVVVEIPSQAFPPFSPIEFDFIGGSNDPVPSTDEVAYLSLLKVS